MLKILNLKQMKKKIINRTQKGGSDSYTQQDIDTLNKKLNEVVLLLEELLAAFILEKRRAINIGDDLENLETQFNNLYEFIKKLRYGSI
jgi:hypothetical protein